MSYITAAEYNSITERPAAEATAARRKRASQLLDARVGNYAPDGSTGWKLDLSELTKHQEDAVKDWVAWMVVYLYDNQGQPPFTVGHLSLGRFSVSAQQGQAGRVLPDEMSFADAILASSGLVRRGVQVK